MSFSQMVVRRLGNFSTTSLEDRSFYGVSGKEEMMDEPDECNDIESRRVVRITKEVHEGMDNSCCDF